MKYVHGRLVFGVKSNDMRCIGQVAVHKRIAPQFSFGIRHSQYTAPLIIDPVD